MVGAGLAKAGALPTPACRGFLIRFIRKSRLKEVKGGGPGKIERERNIDYEK
jgi:hypothetical protein